MGFGLPSCSLWLSEASLKLVKDFLERTGRAYNGQALKAALKFETENQKPYTRKWHQTWMELERNSDMLKPCFYKLFILKINCAY